MIYTDHGAYKDQSVLDEQTARADRNRPAYDTIEHDDEHEQGERQDFVTASMLSHGAAAERDERGRPIVADGVCRSEVGDSAATCDALDLTREKLMQAQDIRMREGADAAVKFAHSELKKLKGKQPKADCQCHDERKDDDMRDAQAILYGHDPLLHARRRLDAERADSEGRAHTDAQRADAEHVARMDASRRAMIRTNRSPANAPWMQTDEDRALDRMRQDDDDGYAEYLHRRRWGR